MCIQEQETQDAGTEVNILNVLPLPLTASPQPPVKRGVKNNTNYTLKFKGKAA